MAGVPRLVFREITSRKHGRRRGLVPNFNYRVDRHGWQRGRGRRGRQCSASNRATLCVTDFPCDPLCPLWLKPLTSSVDTKIYAGSRRNINDRYFQRTTLEAPSLSRRPALRARTNFPQIEPRINSQIVVIVPRKPKRIFAHRLRRQRFHRRLKHRQSPGRELRRLARLASRLGSLILAKRAGTSIPQIRKRIDGPMPILPLNLHPRPRRQMNHHRLRIVPHPRRKIRQRHKLKYRMTPAPRSEYADKLAQDPMSCVSDSATRGLTSQIDNTRFCPLNSRRW